MSKVKEEPKEEVAQLSYEALEHLSCGLKAIIHPLQIFLKIFSVLVLTGKRKVRYRMGTKGKEVIIHNHKDKAICAAELTCI